MSLQRSEAQKAILDRFFSNAGRNTSESECNAFALALYGGTLKHIQRQGKSSYSVIIDLTGPFEAKDKSKFIQFRDPEHPLDLDKLKELHAIFEGFVPACHTNFTNLRSHRGLLVYVMQGLPAIRYSMILPTLGENYKKFKLATVCSLAKFFAKSWKAYGNRELHERTKADLLAASLAYRTELQKLNSCLPKRFHKRLGELLDRMEHVFGNDFPKTSTHPDMSADNLLVNPINGNIEGIVNWEGDRVLPFGLSLYALDIVRGDVTEEGWEDRDKDKALVNQFWREFERANGVSLGYSDWVTIKAARDIGVFLRYGQLGQPGEEVARNQKSWQILDDLILNYSWKSRGVLDRPGD